MRSITLSSMIGRIGLLERENAAIMNACLSELAVRTIAGFRGAGEMHIDAPLYISQNDGTLMSADFAESFPVLTFASGPTNSMRGAAFLTGLKDAIVIDMGGTTTDVGCFNMASRGRRSRPAPSAACVPISGCRMWCRLVWAAARSCRPILSKWGRRVSAMN